MAKKQKKNISRFPNPLQRIFQDSGIILFSIIAVYMIACLIIYWSKPHTSVYEVKYGTLSKDYTYQGLALRTEQLVTADRSGYVTYYAREGQKAGARTTVCAVDETGQLSQMIEQASIDNTLLTSEDILTFKEDVTAYQSAYEPLSFAEVYSFKQNLESSVLELVHLKLLDAATQSITDTSAVNICKSASDGILSYCVDGMEMLSIDDITKKSFDKNNYQAVDLKKQTSIQASEPIYKLITEDDWSVVIEVSPEIAQMLLNEKYIEVTFLRDHKTAWGEVNSWEADGTTFVQFSFTNSMVRYASERYLDIRFSLNDVKGLKIPVSAVTKEEFYIIPKEYIAKGGDDNSDGVFLEKYQTDGSVKQVFEPLTIIADTDSSVYVSMKDFNSGNTLLKPESAERFSIGRTESLDGVYNINQGYTVFCPITVVSQNKEYYIVDPNQSHGLSQYDRIILDASTAENNQLLY